METLTSNNSELNSSQTKEFFRNLPEEAAAFVNNLEKTGKLLVYPDQGGQVFKGWVAGSIDSKSITLHRNPFTGKNFNHPDFSSGNVKQIETQPSFLTVPLKEFLSWQQNNTDYYK